MSDREPAKAYRNLAWGQRKLGVGRRAFLKLVASGEIGVLSLPGLPDRFDADDIDRIYREGLRPATRRELATTA